MILDEPEKGINRTWTETSIDWLFYLVGIAIIAISLAKILVTPHDSLDIQLHDTFIVLAASPTFLLVGLFWIILGMIYSFTNRNQKAITSRWWGLMHFFITLIGSILVSSPYYLYPNSVDVFPGGQSMMESYYIKRDVFLAGLVVFALGQLLLLHLVRRNNSAMI